MCTKITNESINKKDMNNKTHKKHNNNKNKRKSIKNNKNNNRPPTLYIKDHATYIYIYVLFV